MKTFFLALGICCGTAYGQDAGAMAAQQAMQLSQQASQQAMQDMQQASQIAQQNMQQAVQNSQIDQGSTTNAGWCFPYGVSDVLSLPVAPGVVKPGTKVPIKWQSGRAAEVFYTTDGWTPTTESTRYKRPIVIDGTTKLRAMLFDPGTGRRMFIGADYDVVGGAAPDESLQVGGGVMRRGLPLRLATGSEVNSQTAWVGDEAGIVLDEDVKDGDAVVAAKGTEVDAVLTGVTAANGVAAGKLVFALRGLSVDGVMIPLTGGETVEGQNGKPAVIEPGMQLTATVAKDVSLRP